MAASMLCVAWEWDDHHLPMLLNQQQANSWDSAMHAQNMYSTNPYGNNIVEPMRVERQANSHILAERKRRQKLTQKFIALSSLIPGLKKIDKASVLGDAILEDEQRKKKSTVLVEIFSDKEKIEARFCDSDVLIVIHCLKTKGILPKTVAQIEKLHLSVVNSCTMSFGDSTLNITISAQKDEDFSMSAEELMMNLRGALDQ